MRGHAEVIASEVHRMLETLGDDGEIDVLDFFAELTMYTSSACLIGPEFREELTSEYYATMWSVLSPHGYFRLTVVAQFAVPFGDTAVNKLTVWSGQHGKKHPNEILHRETTKWAQIHGYRTYGFEGIDLRGVEALSGGGSLPPDLKQSMTNSKLGLGGDVRMFPCAYFEAIRSIVLRLHGFTSLKLANWESGRKGVAMLRTNTRSESNSAKVGSVE
jgi:hypothetical protein